MKISLRFLSYRVDTTFILIISKGHYSANKNGGAVLVLFFGTLSDDTFYLYQV